MPFTFSHPAAVLPFKWLPKKWFSMTGLIIGSIIPDFEAFLTLSPDKRYSHSMLGVFLFDLPLAILLCFLFHDIVKRSFLDNLPLYFKRRFFRYRSFNWDEYFKRHFHIALLSILIGIGTHLLWDRFTHADEYLPGAIIRIHIIGGYDTLLFILIQYISSVLGMIVVVFFIVKQPQQTGVSETSIVRYWLIAGIATLIIAVFRLWNTSIDQSSYKDIIAYIIISAALGGIIIASLFNRSAVNRI